MYQLIIETPVELIGKIFLFKNEDQINEKMLKILKEDIKKDLSLPYQHSHIEEKLEELLDEDFEKKVEIQLMTDLFLIDDEEEMTRKKDRFYNELGYVIDRTLPIKEKNEDQIKNLIIDGIKEIEHIKRIDVKLEVDQEKLKEVWEKEKHINIIPFEIYKEIAKDIEKEVTLEISKNKNIFFGGELTW